MTQTTIVPVSTYNAIKEGAHTETKVLQPRDYLLTKPGSVHNHNPIDVHVENGAVIGYRFHLKNGPVEFLAEPLDYGEYKTLDDHKRWCKTRANTRKARVSSLPEFLEAAYQAYAMQDVYPAARAFLQNIQRLMPDNWYCFDSLAKYDGERAVITHTDGKRAHTVEEIIPTFNNHIILAREQHPGLIGTTEENLDEAIHKALQALGGQYCTPANLQRLALIERSVTHNESVYENEQDRATYAKWVQENNFRQPRETINLAREVGLWTPNLEQRSRRRDERVLGLGGVSVGRLDINASSVDYVGRACGVVDAKNFEGER